MSTRVREPPAARAIDLWWNMYGTERMAGMGSWRKTATCLVLYRLIPSLFLSPKVSISHPTVRSTETDRPFALKPIFLFFPNGHRFTFGDLAVVLMVNSNGVALRKAPRAGGSRQDQRKFNERSCSFSSMAISDYSD